MDKYDVYNVDVNHKSKKKYSRRIHEKKDFQIKKQELREKKSLEKLISKKYSKNGIRKYNFLIDDLPINYNEEIESEPEPEIEIESESEDDDLEYYNYGTEKDGSFIVAGGGLMNKNAYATVEKRGGKYYYLEYGNNPVIKYLGNVIKWSNDRRKDGRGSFKII